MTGAIVAFSPVYTYLTVRTGSVLVAAFLHGSFNGLGTFSFIHFAGGGHLLVAPVGVAGIGAGLLATGLCRPRYAHCR